MCSRNTRRSVLPGRTASFRSQLVFRVRTGAASAENWKKPIFHDFAYTQKVPHFQALVNNIRQNFCFFSGTKRNGSLFVFQYSRITCCSRYCVRSHQTSCQKHCHCQGIFLLFFTQQCPAEFTLCRALPNHWPLCLRFCFSKPYPYSTDLKRTKRKLQAVEIRARNLFTCGF